jgi:predicted ester cyclase
MIKKDFGSKVAPGFTPSFTSIDVRIIMSIDNNQEIIISFFENLNSHSIRSLNKYVTSNFIWHGNRSQSLRATVKDLTSLIGAFPDATWFIEDIIAQDDKVCVRWVFTGTHLKDWEKFSASGKSITYGGISLCPISNSKLAKVWNNENLLSFFQQMGGVLQI